MFSKIKQLDINSDISTGKELEQEIILNKTTPRIVQTLTNKFTYLITTSTSESISDMEVNNEEEYTDETFSSEDDKELSKRQSDEYEYQDNDESNTMTTANSTESTTQKYHTHAKKKNRNRFFQTNE